MVRAKLRAYQDTGIPEGSTDYTTVVIVHGYVWHSGTFSRLIPISKAYNTRIILVNRRDYPGTIPYDEEDLKVLQSCLAPPEDEIGIRREKLLHFTKERGGELYDFLNQLILDAELPVAQKEKNTGGIIVVGWSFGAVWMLALLAYVSSLPADNEALGKCIRRIVCHDPGHRLLGFTDHDVPDPYSPVLDPSIPKESKGDAFNAWITSYFEHGSTPTTLQTRIPLVDPPSTVSRLTPSELAAMIHAPPGEADVGSDSLLHRGGLVVGMYESLRKCALYLTDDVGPAWRDVEVRFLWCLKSVWDVPYAMMRLREELEAAKDQGTPVRNVNIVRVEGNHFVHWDAPELSMRAFLEADVEEVRP